LYFLKKSINQDLYADAKVALLESLAHFISEATTMQKFHAVAIKVFEKAKYKKGNN